MLVWFCEIMSMEKKRREIKEGKIKTCTKVV